MLTVQYATRALTNKEQTKCLIDVIERDCECSSFLFPRNRNATEQLKPCGFIQQVIFNTDRLWEGSSCIFILMIYLSPYVFHDMSKNSIILNAYAIQNADTVNAYPKGNSITVIPLSYLKGNALIIPSKTQTPYLAP